jgi:hypothetical protein
MLVFQQIMQRKIIPNSELKTPICLSERRVYFLFVLHPSSFVPHYFLILPFPLGPLGVFPGHKKTIGEATKMEE